MVVKSEVVSVNIPKQIYLKIKEKISGSKYSSVDEYIIAKLEEGISPEAAYTKEEEELIKERLRRLGYLE